MLIIKGDSPYNMGSFYTNRNNTFYSGISSRLR